MVFSFDQVGTQRYCISLANKRILVEEEGVDVELAGELVFSRSAGSDNDLLLQGELTGCFTGQCSFCASDLSFSFDEKFTYRLCVGREELPGEHEVELFSEKVETLFLSAPEIDLDEILREQIRLNLPMQLSCRQDCKGVCSGCGVNLNNEQCCCDTTAPSSPFAVLSKLKKYS
ncbi:MAG: hypothetical protein CSA21_00055 [Deltaproteobacteria bacterium]|nr:MAG: hypothetical protein CSA21_00055 [Deltaproteobacteria bacterium]